MRRLTHKQLRTIGLVLAVFAAVMVAGLTAGSSVLYASNYEASYWNNKELSGNPAERYAAAGNHAQGRHPAKKIEISVSQV